jgi:hypothetical protein
MMKMIIWTMGIQRRQTEVEMGVEKSAPKVST